MADQSSATAASTQPVPGPAFSPPPRDEMAVAADFEEYKILQSFFRYKYATTAMSQRLISNSKWDANGNGPSVAFTLCLPCGYAPEGPG